VSEPVGANRSALCHPGLSLFVRAWARALHATRYVPMTREARYELLTTLAGRLAVGLVAEPFNPTIGYWVGVDLVHAEYAVPDSLGRTVAVLNERFLADLGHTTDAARRRLDDLLAALVTGFARAAHDATLEGQDAVRQAAYAAHAQAERELRHRARHDRLTGLPNRFLFQQRLQELLATPAPDALVGLCSIDLDGFQRVNDSLGHPVGDRLLVGVAQRLADLAAEGGHLLARLDGDEFAVLLSSRTGMDEATKLADRVVAVLAEPFRIDGHEVPVSASTGVVEVPVAGADATELIRAADLALHWAKSAGGGQWTRYDRGRSARDVWRYRLSAAMPAALARGEFTLAYQPLVTLADGALVGVEALARWRHPRLGILGANHFISLAEDTGLIVPLGLRLLEESCAAARGMQSRFVSVNLAARQIRQPGLVATVAEVLDRTGLPAARLQLEITESAVIDTDRGTLETLRGLADLGVRLVVDDFGTGYSNLANLPVLPIHGLKLAAAFIRGRPEEFLRAVVALGRTLGLTVTAEGIESAEQARLLREVGCDLGQGWYFGRPEIVNAPA
jgi:diguanylate cyclase (GGDEF)-like protein